MATIPYVKTRVGKFDHFASTTFSFFLMAR